MKKGIKKTAATISGIGLLAISVLVHTNMPLASEVVQGEESSMQEREESDGVISIKVSYSDDIKPAQGDQFIITYAPEDDLSKTASIQVNGYAYANSEMEEKIPAGTYSILDIEYFGSNEEIVGQGYCSPITMYCADGIPGSITIGVGEQQVTSLANSYGEGKLRIKDADHTDTGESVKSNYGTKYEAKGAPEVDTDAGDGGNDKAGYTVVKEGEYTHVDDASEGDTVHVDLSIDDTVGEADAPVTDTGEGKTIIYSDAEDGKKEEDSAKKDKENQYSGIFRKFIGLVIFAGAGLGCMIFAHKTGKI